MVTKMNKRETIKRGFISVVLVGIDGVLRLLKKAGTMDSATVEERTDGAVWDENPIQLAFKNKPLPTEEKPAYRLPRKGTKMRTIVEVGSKQGAFSVRSIVLETGYENTGVSGSLGQLVKRGLVVIVHRASSKREGHTYTVPNAVKALL